MDYHYEETMTTKRPFPFYELGAEQIHGTRNKRLHELHTWDQYPGWYPDQHTDPSYVESPIGPTQCPEQASSITTATPLSLWPNPVLTLNEVCFGSIIDVKAQVRLRLPSSLMSHTSCQVCTIPIAVHNGIFTLNCLQSGDKFAVLNKKTCHDLQVLETVSKTLRFQAYITSMEWNRVERLWKPEASITLSIDINIYGNFEYASSVGRVLTSSRTYLQQPLHGIEGVRYYNPQFLHIRDLLGETVTETPLVQVAFPAVSNPKSNGNVDAQQEQQEQDDTRQIHSILNSLSHRRIATDRRTSDKRMKTNLLPHQAEAMDFIGQRETGSLNHELSLWDHHNEDHESHQTIYRHRITGARTTSPADAKGGIIADDMGLGKTLLVLYTVAGSLHRAGGFASRAADPKGEIPNRIRSKATLVVVPSSLLIDSWMDEIRYHTNPGYLTYYKHHGEGRQDKACQQQLLEKDIILTTYATVASEANRGQNILGRIHWFRIVLDEAHEVRNRSTKQNQAIVSLAAEHRWCLTGTPIQNSIDDLGSLISFLKVPILENPTTFRKFIATPSTGNSKDRFKGLQQLLGSICIRRLRDLLDLPEPTRYLQRVDLSKTEREEYNHICMQFRRNADIAISRYGKQNFTSTALKALLELRLFCNNGSSRNSISDSRNADEVLTELQQEDRAECAYCASHVYSISNADTDDTDGAILIRNCYHLLCRNCIPRYQADHLRCPGCCKEETNLTASTGFQPVGSSGDHSPAIGTPMELRLPTKVEALMRDILSKPPQKSIVFSSWKRTLDLIGQALAHRNIRFCSIHGSLSLSQRKRVIDEFRLSFGSANILLMTLGTGAVGLNLAVASRIYLMEPQWNPSISEQAIGRCYRLGQTKNVSVIEFIMKDTVEDSNVLPRQRAKIRLAGGGFEKRKRGVPPERVQAFLETVGYDANDAAAAKLGIDPSQATIPRTYHN